MALVVLLRGVNVGGHRTFRPTLLAERLKHLDAVSIGAAGTFVVRRPVSRARIRDEFARRLPFDATIMICQGSEVARLISGDWFRGHPVRPDTVRFVSVLSRLPRAAPPLPLRVPPTGAWLVRLLAREGRFVIGLYRRQMKAIGQLGRLDRVFGEPVTTRSWSTLTEIGRVLGLGATEGSRN
jgi:uncharacterized protein (DUF1697 family)